VPGLRNVALTAPYMHNGSLASLRDVVRHYSEINETVCTSTAEKILRKLQSHARRDRRSRRLPRVAEQRSNRRRSATERVHVGLRS